MISTTTTSRKKRNNKPKGRDAFGKMSKAVAAFVQANYPNFEYATLVVDTGNRQKMAIPVLPNR
jgi:hypothetical protein